MSDTNNGSYVNYNTAFDDALTRRGITARHAAELAGLSEATLSKIRTGKAGKLHGRTLARLAAVLEIDPNALGLYNVR